MSPIRFFIEISFISILCALVGTQDIETIRGRNFSESIEKNDLYIRTMEDFEWTGYTLYFLDSVNGKIIEVDSRNGKTIREISRKGQGPAELMYPIRLRLKNQKLLILHQGNRALKIFDISGGYIGQFKPKAFNNPYFYKTFDVNQKDEIFSRNRTSKTERWSPSMT